MIRHVITRKLEFDAGHRVYKHESKCNNIHGHRYVVEVDCTGSLDTIGRVIDFSVIKAVCGKWLDDYMDHGMILWRDDPLCNLWAKLGSHTHGHELAEYGPHKYYVMDSNPTAENLAEHLYYKFNDMLAEYYVRVVAVRIYETPNCMAEYSSTFNG